MKTTQSRRLSAIDIGSNTVKLLIADCSERGIIPLSQRSTQTRLGAGLNQEGRLAPDAIQRTVDVVQRYLDESRKHEVESVSATATSAVRTAKNGASLVARLRQEFDLELCVLSGSEEADLIYLGISTTRSNQSEHEIIVDIGGGSTEAIIAREGQMAWRQSFEVGSVRLLEHCDLSPPISPDTAARFYDHLTNQYHPLITAAREQFPFEQPIDLVAAGGGAVAASMLVQGLTTFQANKIDSHPLGQKDLVQLRDRLWATSIEERRRIPGMPPERADIMPIAISALVHLLQEFNQTNLHVSTAGLRFGLVRRMFSETPPSTD